MFANFVPMNVANIERSMNIDNIIIGFKTTENYILTLNSKRLRDYHISIENVVDYINTWWGEEDITIGIVRNKKEKYSDLLDKYNIDLSEIHEHSTFMILRKININRTTISDEDLALLADLLEEISNYVRNGNKLKFNDQLEHADILDGIRSVATA